MLSGLWSFAITGYFNFHILVFVYCAASIKICINGCGCLCLWETWLINLKIAVRLEEVWVRSSAWAFFLHTFFITFINFPSAVEMSRSLRNFSTIRFFCESYSIFSNFEKTVSKFLQLSVTQNSNFLAKFFISRDTHIHWCRFWLMQHSIILVLK